MVSFLRISRLHLLLLALLSQGAAVGMAQQEQQIPHDAPHCDNNSLSGGYGFSVNGTSMNSGPYSLVGRFVADGKGGVTGMDVQAVNGSISRPSFTGTYTVKPDCTGTANLTFDWGGTAPLEFTIVDDGKQVYIIVAGENGSNGQNEVGTATRQFTKPRVL